MRYKSALFAILSVLLLSSHAFAQDISYTLEDRDRLIRLEAKVEQIDKRFEQIDSRIERLEGVMIWGFSLLFATMIGMVGFVLWDRRTALAPAIRESRELREREERIERILKEVAVKDANVAEALRHAGL